MSLYDCLENTPSNLENVLSKIPETIRLQTLNPEDIVSMYYTPAALAFRKQAFSPAYETLARHGASRAPEAYYHIKRFSHVLNLQRIFSFQTTANNSILIESGGFYAKPAMQLLHEILHAFIENLRRTPSDPSPAENSVLIRQAKQILDDFSISMQVYADNGPIELHSKLYNKNRTVYLLTGYSGHAVAISFKNNSMFYANKGGNSKYPGIFTIQLTRPLTPILIKFFAEASGYLNYLHYLSNGADPVDYQPGKFHGPFCAFANTKYLLKPFFKNHYKLFTAFSRNWGMNELIRLKHSPDTTPEIKKLILRLIRTILVQHCGFPTPDRSFRYDYRQMLMPFSEPTYDEEIPFEEFMSTDYKANLPSEPPSNRRPEKTAIEQRRAFTLLDSLTPTELAIVLNFEQEPFQNEAHLSYFRECIQKWLRGKKTDTSFIKTQLKFPSNAQEYFDRRFSQWITTGNSRLLKKWLTRFELTRAEYKNLLYLAIELGKVNLVETLLIQANRASFLNWMFMNSVSSKENNFLQTAIKHRHVAIARLLFRHGAELDADTTDLILAIKTKDLGILTTWFEYGNVTFGKYDNTWKDILNQVIFDDSLAIDARAELLCYLLDSTNDIPAREQFLFQTIPNALDLAIEAKSVTLLAKLLTIISNSQNPSITYLVNYQRAKKILAITNPLTAITDKELIRIGLAVCTVLKTLLQRHINREELGAIGTLIHRVSDNETRLTNRLTELATVSSHLHPKNKLKAEPQKYTAAKTSPIPPHTLRKSVEHPLFEAGQWDSDDEKTQPSHPNPLTSPAALHAVPSRFSVNQATQHFKANSLLKFENWYTEDVVKYLTHTAPRNHPSLRFVLQSGTTVEQEKQENHFISSLQSLLPLMNSIGTNAISFITFEPGTMQTHHFIFGILTNKNQLLIINPMGETSHKGFYDVLKEAKRKNIISALYISNIKLQHDANQIASCGPLCVELMRHFSITDLSQINLDQLPGNEQSEEGVTFFAKDITTLLPDRIRRYTSCTPENYRQGINEIRKAHLQQLQQVFSDQVDISKRDQLLQGCLQDKGEQYLMWRLTQDKIGILQLIQEAEYAALRAQLPPPPQADSEPTLRSSTM